MPQIGRYIGTPNGIVLCVNNRDAENIEGELYHGYSKKGISFIGYEEIIKIAEKLFNALGFPYMGTSDRDINGRNNTYNREEGMARVLEDEEMLAKHGDKGTFVIRVQHRQHSSWQGRVTWLEEDKSVYFRSALELIKIIDGALDQSEQSFAKEENENK